MEFYDSEGKKHRGKNKKKGEVLYYYDSKKKLVKVPNLHDPPQKIKEFVLFCVGATVPDVTESQISVIWERSLENNDKIIKGLEEHRQTLINEDENKFKIMMYTKAIAQIKSLHIPILSGAQAANIKGIGKNISERIDRILKT